MAKITISGYSDDLIEVAGDLSEEGSHVVHWLFPYQPDGDGMLVGCSDGTLLGIEYGACWRITLIARGTATFDLKQAVESDEDDRSDVATLEGVIAWVMVGTGYVS